MPVQFKDLWPNLRICHNGTKTANFSPLFSQVGNQQGYADIDEQRQLEMNYKFSLDELSKDTDAKVKRYGDSSSSLPQTGGGDAEPKTVEQPEEISSPSASKEKSSPHKHDDSEL